MVRLTGPQKHKYRELKINANHGIFVLFIVCCACNDEVCIRKPLGTKTESLRPDNQFVLEVDRIKDNQYIPGDKYTVVLRSKNTSFIAFTIALKEDAVYNKNNPRKPTRLYAGELSVIESTVAKPHPHCNNTIIQSDVTAKRRVEVQWKAPPKDNKCVSIYAMVAITKDIWYSYDPPLSLKVCEDPRKSEDMPPQEIDGDCKTCEDARFRLIFEGLWSYNTHQNMFPGAREMARFSDVVGASHSPDTSLFKIASEATIGLKMLAEQGNTTQFEIEIQLKLPTTVRTVIKATRPESTNMSTVTSFRASPQHHRLSIAAGIMPSPDWFLGVAQLELCDEKGLNWRREIKLNLYPIDAGTDKGVDFEASNEEQSPFQPISFLPWIGKGHKIPKKPFARIRVERVRTYMTPSCSESNLDTQTKGEGESEEESTSNEVEEPTPRPTRRPPRVRTTTTITTTTTTTTSEAPPEVDPNSSDSCPMTEWEDWQECNGICENDVIVSGLQMRQRHHVVDGVIVDIEDGSVSEDCIGEQLEGFQKCTGPCQSNGEEDEEAEDEGETEASRRMWNYFKNKK